MITAWDTDQKTSKTSLPPEDRLERFRNLLGISGNAGNLLANLPFGNGDVTAGTENELQVVVKGSPDDCDLPLFIKNSNYYKNIREQALQDDMPTARAEELEEFLSGNTSRVWEHSWVRFPMSRLSGYARLILDEDLLKDKKEPDLGKRDDADRFFFEKNGETWLRVPVSYLLKLAIADSIGRTPLAHATVRVAGKSAMDHFLSDNTSPETFSFYPSWLRKTHSHGEEVARETLKRFLLTHLLTLYAGKRFGLEENGQEVKVYFSPHPPVRQKKLNSLVTDSFYREIFMSPCLSGWDRGEEKHKYMILCHQVLSRSQLNTISRLKDSGIIQSNLAVLPNTSNISLANNGTHVSLGSLKLTRLCKDKGAGFEGGMEKYYGDLSIKMFEYFLPIFTCILSGSPCRMDFEDFHPEQALGFLPHELEDIHLRMIWREWKRKAGLRFMGRSITPFGPVWLDRMLKKVLHIKGDLVPDFRIIDYLCALKSTMSSPALDGTQGNNERLKKDLMDLGVFDTRMPMYLPVRQRLFGQMGFSGFEGRHYSLFESVKNDMTAAVNLQMLLTALTFSYILKGEVDHESIPDKPFMESERRQIFFAQALGNPCFFVSRKKTSPFLSKILKEIPKIRESKNYPGFWVIGIKDYLKALVNIIKKDGADLIEMFGFTGLMGDLERRISGESVSEKLVNGICSSSGIKDPVSVDADTFNRNAEEYFREGLFNKHISEAIEFMDDDIRRLEMWAGYRDSAMQASLSGITEGKCSIGAFYEETRDRVFSGKADADQIMKLIHIVLVSIQADRSKHQISW